MFILKYLSYMHISFIYVKGYFQIINFTSSILNGISPLKFIKYCKNSLYSFEL